MDHDKSQNMGQSMDTVTITKDQLASVLDSPEACAQCCGTEKDTLHGPPEQNCFAPTEHHTYRSQLDQAWEKLQDASNDNLSRCNYGDAIPITDLSKPVDGWPY